MVMVELVVFSVVACRAHGAPRYITNKLIHRSHATHTFQQPSEQVRKGNRFNAGSDT